MKVQGQKNVNSTWTVLISEGGKGGGEGEGMLNTSIFLHLTW